MHSILKPGITLFVIAAIAAGILGYVNAITAEPIAQQVQIAKDNAMKNVFPSAESFEEAADYSPADGAAVKSYSKALDTSGSLLGYAVTAASKGYGGDVTLMIGIDTQGVVTGVNVTGHSETPGLGANAANPAFSDQFAGKSGELAVVKTVPGDNEIQAITSATITSKAVTLAVNEALSFYAENLQGGAE